MSPLSKEQGLTIEDALLLSAAVHILKSIDSADTATVQELSYMAQRLEKVVNNHIDDSEPKLKIVSAI